MGHRAGPALLHREAGLGAVQRLDLALLVHAQDNRLVGRVQVEANDIGKLLGEAGVLGELEGPHLVRLEAVGVPDAVDRGGAHPLCLRHRAATPVRRSRRQRVERRFNDAPDLLGRDRWLAATARGDPGKRPGPTVFKPAAPEDHRRPGYPDIPGYAIVGSAASGHQDDPRPHHHTLLSTRRSHPAFKKVPFLLGNRDRFRCIPHAAESTIPRSNCPVI